MRFLRLFAVAFVLCMAAAFTAACGSDDDDGAASEDGSGEPIVIGHVGGLTGVLEAYDTAVSVGMKSAIDDINADGGLLGRKLELSEVDTASDTAKNVSATRQVLEDGANFVMVPSDFNFGAPVARFANAQGKVAVGFVGDAKFGKSGVGPLTFNIWQGTETESAALAEWAFNDKGIKHPYLLKDTSNAYGISNCDSFAAAFEKLAGQGSLAGTDTFQGTDTSVRSQVAAIKRSADADAVMVCSFPPGGVTPIREMRAQGVDLPILIGAGYEGNYWQSAVPDLKDVYGSAMLSIFATDDNPTLKELTEQFKADTGNDAVTATFLAGGHMAVELLAKGIESAESDDPEAVAKAIEQLGSVELFGLESNYSTECHVPVGRPTHIVEYSGTEGKVVATVAPEFVPNKLC
jgi:branched-chain amino acid transport system substrate-binding protein